MSAIEIFQSEDWSIRVIDVDGEPVFVARDVCAAVGIAKPRDAVAQLDSDERVSIAVDTPGGRQQMAAVTEPGLYSLLSISRSPQARPFRRWVNHEVLPEIRRTGSYGAAPAVAEVSRRDLALMVVEAEDAREAAELRASAAEQAAAELEPAASAWSTMADATGDWSVREAAQILGRDPGIDIGAGRLWGYLREIRWIGRHGQLPLQTARDAGRLTTRVQTYWDKAERVEKSRPQTRITHKGLTELHARLGGTSPLNQAQQLALTTGGAS